MISLDCDHDLHGTHCGEERCGCSCHAEQVWRWWYGWTAIDIEAVAR